MNPEGQLGQQPPTFQQPNGVPPVNNGWPQQSQPTQQSGAITQPGQQSSQPPTPLQPPQQPYTLPSGADGHAPEYSIDYLNQIAPKEHKVINRFAVLGLIAAGVISALFAVIIIASSGGSSANDQIVPISQRITTLQSVTTAQQKHLAEDQISQANAALSSSLVSTGTNLKSIMKERKLNDASDSSSAKSEKTYKAELTKTLEDSYQRGTLDRTYTVQMTYELTVLKTKLTKLKQSADSKEIKQFCDTTLDNISLILSSYASFDATKS